MDASGLSVIQFADYCAEMVEAEEAKINARKEAAKAQRHEAEAKKANGASQ